MNIDRLERLDKLRKSGALTEEEFQKEKERLLDDTLNSPGKNLQTNGNQKFGLSDSNFNVLLHLSQYCNFFMPLIGTVVPILLWTTNKENDDAIDQHGKNIINWNISSTIYLIVSFILCFFIIGIPLIFIVIILYTVFPIIGAIKADSGEVWKYPLSNDFIK